MCAFAWEEEAGVSVCTRHAACPCVACVSEQQELLGGLLDCHEVVQDTHAHTPPREGLTKAVARAGLPVLLGIHGPDATASVCVVS